MSEISEFLRFRPFFVVVSSVCFEDAIGSSMLPFSITFGTKLFLQLYLHEKTLNPLVRTWIADDMGRKEVISIRRFLSSQNLVTNVEMFRNRQHSLHVGHWQSWVCNSPCRWKQASRNPTSGGKWYCGYQYKNHGQNRDDRFYVSWLRGRIRYAIWPPRHLKLL